MAGRPRKPTALRVLQGNPGKRPLPKNEPHPPVGCEPPPWLGIKARAEWGRMAPRLIELGLLTAIDGEAFAAICMHMVNLGTLAKVQDKLGPAEAILGAAALANTTKELRLLLGRFGMTPADRAKVSVPPPKEKDEFGAIFG